MKPNNTSPAKMAYNVNTVIKAMEPLIKKVAIRMDILTPLDVERLDVFLNYMKSMKVMLDDIVLDKDREKYVREKMLECGFKMCPDCDRCKPVSDFYPSKHTATGYRSQCTECKPSESENNKKRATKKYRKAYIAKNPEKVAVENAKRKARYHETKEVNRERRKQQRMEWIKNNPERHLMNLDRMRKNEVIGLSDGYVRRLLKKQGVPVDSMDELQLNELIKTQKLIIKTKRLCKTSQNSGRA